MVSLLQSRRTNAKRLKSALSALCRPLPPTQDIGVFFKQQESCRSEELQRIELQWSRATTCIDFEPGTPPATPRLARVDSPPAGALEYSGRAEGWDQCGMLSPRLDHPRYHMVQKVSPGGGNTCSLPGITAPVQLHHWSPCPTFLGIVQECWQGFNSRETN